MFFLDIPFYRTRPHFGVCSLMAISRIASSGGMEEKYWWQGAPSSRGARNSLSSAQSSQSRRISNATGVSFEEVKISFLRWLTGTDVKMRLLILSVNTNSGKVVKSTRSPTRDDSMSKVSNNLLIDEIS